MNILIFDTETTGLPLFREPSDHPDQPHVVDIACDLFAGPGDLLDRFDAIINPGVDIPAEASDVHGITTERARDEGIDPDEALGRFFDLAARADLIVGHNISFDIRMMRIMSARLRGEKWENPLPTFCTMRKSTNHCQILKAKPRFSEDWKSPKLVEAYQHFFGEDLADAHRARPDADAAGRIYFHLMSMEKAA
jgi:DNA polymerase III subunit epsilon